MRIRWERNVEIQSFIVGEIGCDVSHCGSSRTGSDDEVRITYNASLTKSVEEGFGSGSKGRDCRSSDDFNGEETRHCESSVLQSFKLSGIDRCTSHEEGGAAEFLKTCSCSFCLTGPC